MSFLTALFKNPLERAFQRSALSIDLSKPLQAGYTSYASTYNGKQAQVLLYPKETLESAFLLKHPAFPRIHAYTKYVENGVERWAVLTDPLQPLSSTAMQLVGLKAALQALAFLFENGLRLARFNRSAIAFQQGQAVFIQLDAICAGGAEFAEISQHLQAQFAETAQFGVKFAKDLKKTLDQPALSGELFELLENFDYNCKNTQFLQRLANYARGAPPQLNAQVFIPLALRQLALSFDSNLHRATCILADASGAFLPADAFDAIVRAVFNQPDLAPNLLYFKDFSQLGKDCAGAMLELTQFLLQKQPSSQTLCKLAELAATLFKQQAEAIVARAKAPDAFFGVLGAAIRTYQTKTDYLVSWNLFCGLAAILQQPGAASGGDSEKDGKGSASDTAGPGKLLGAATAALSGLFAAPTTATAAQPAQQTPPISSATPVAQMFVKHIFSPALASISACYDAIQAILCCSRVLSVLSEDQALALYTAMSTPHALRRGLYSGKARQRELALYVRTQIDGRLTVAASQADAEDAPEDAGAAGKQAESVRPARANGCNPKTCGWGDSEDESGADSDSGSDSGQAGLKKAKIPSSESSEEFKESKAVRTASAATEARSGRATKHTVKVQNEDNAQAKKPRRNPVWSSSDDSEASTNVGEVKAKSTSTAGRGSGKSQQSAPATVKAAKTVVAAKAAKKSAWDDSDDGE